MLLIFGGSWFIVDAVFDHDVQKAEEYCAQYDATPRYTKNTRYFCVTQDGRIVG